MNEETTTTELVAEALHRIQAPQETVKLKWVWWHGRKYTAPRGYRIVVGKSLQRIYADPLPMSNRDRLINYVKQNGTTKLTARQERRLRKKVRRTYG